MGLVHEMKETGRRLRELIPQKQLLPLQKCSDEVRILGILLNNSKEGQDHGIWSGLTFSPDSTLLQVLLSQGTRFSSKGLQ